MRSSSCGTHGFRTPRRCRSPRSCQPLAFRSGTIPPGEVDVATLQCCCNECSKPAYLFRNDCSTNSVRSQANARNAAHQRCANTGGFAAICRAVGSTGGIGRRAPILGASAVAFSHQVGLATQCPRHLPMQCRASIWHTTLAFGVFVEVLVTALRGLTCSWLERSSASVTAGGMIGAAYQCASSGDEPEEFFPDPSAVPSWLGRLLNTTYFQTCPRHRHMKKNDVRTLCCCSCQNRLLLH